MPQALLRARETAKKSGVLGISAYKMLMMEDIQVLPTFNQPDAGPKRSDKGSNSDDAMRLRLRVWSWSRVGKSRRYPANRIAKSEQGKNKDVVETSPVGIRGLLWGGLRFVFDARLCGSKFGVPREGATNKCSDLEPRRSLYTKRQTHGATEKHVATDGS